MQALAPRLPLLGRLPAPPALPVWVPGLGLRSTEALLAALAPPLSAEEGIYLQSLRQLSASLLGAPSMPAPERCSTLECSARVAVCGSVRAKKAAHVR